MKSSLFLVVSCAVLAVSLLLPGSVSALVNSVLYVQGPGGSVLVNTSIAVPEICTVQDSAGVSHTFSGHKAICALQAATDAEVITGFQVTDAGFGFSLDSVNGIANTPGWAEFWHLWQNGSLADVGIQGIVLSEGDDFQLTYGPWMTGIVSAPPATPGGPVVTDIYPKHLRVGDAVSFLVANQHADGSFGHPLFTDWVAIALGAYKGNSASAFYAKNELAEWLKRNPIPAESPLTDFERRAMALMALGIHPSTGTSTDYIQAILDEFDGQQFGNANLVNDDIFALLVLLKMGYQENEKSVASALRFVLSSQRENGSWGDVDMSAATIQMLDLVSSSQERDEAIARAIVYLEGKQEGTGGFGNVYTTSWVLQAIAAMQGNGDSWVIDNRTPEHFLAFQQALDGGLLQTESKENRIWATSYAIPAALGKSWGSALSTFEKPPLALSSQREILAPPVLQNDNGVTISVVEAMKEQIAVLQREVAVLQKLEQVQEELGRIALEVEFVRLGVASLRVQYLAQSLERQRTFAKTVQEGVGQEFASTHEDSENELATLFAGTDTFSQESETAESFSQANVQQATQKLTNSFPLVVSLLLLGAGAFLLLQKSAFFPAVKKALAKLG